MGTGMCCLTSSLVPPYGNKDLVCYLGLWFHLWEQGPGLLTSISGSTYGNWDVLHATQTILELVKSRWRWKAIKAKAGVDAHWAEVIVEVRGERAVDAG